MVLTWQWRYAIYDCVSIARHTQCNTILYVKNDVSQHQLHSQKIKKLKEIMQKVSNMKKYVLITLCVI